MKNLIMKVNFLDDYLEESLVVPIKVYNGVISMMTESIFIEEVVLVVLGFADISFM